MTKPVKLSDEQEADIKARYWKGLEHAERARINGQTALSEEFSIAQGWISQIAAGHNPSTIEDSIVTEIQDRYEQGRIDLDISRINSVRTLSKEYGIGTDRVRRIAGAGCRKAAYRAKKKNKTSFLTMKLLCSFPGAVGYY